MVNSWQELFELACTHLEAANIQSKDWVFGGGTVLMHKFQHRLSKDIDIFLHDPQVMTALSPRLNDSIENHVLNYSEMSNVVRLTLDKGEIDFILAKNITGIKPDFLKVHTKYVQVENPVEIIAKKIHYRAEGFKPRDVFDLAVVYSKRKQQLLDASHAVVDKMDILHNRIELLSKNSLLDNELKQLSVLPAGEKIREHTLSLVNDFLVSVEKKLDNAKTKSLEP